jgi:hypothetical protein
MLLGLSSQKGRVRSVGGGGARGHWVLLGISWFNGTGLLWNSIFSSENIPFKTLHFKSFKSKGLAIYVSKIKPSKIFRLKLPKARINEGIRPPIFGHFWMAQKCPFCPLCAVNFKKRFKNTKKQGCEHYGHKTCFWSEKHVTDLFSGVGGCVYFGRLK